MLLNERSNNTVLSLGSLFTPSGLSPYLGEGSPISLSYKKNSDVVRGLGGGGLGDGDGNQAAQAALRR